ncbi:hypothetical protein [Variovorax sp. UC74_104]|uniref:hypothetical protein n=1 Tax=Variovorax sp. UC74_104 TaxID=3374555 RepID=UPI003757D46C
MDEMTTPAPSEAPIHPKSAAGGEFIELHDRGNEMTLAWSGPDLLDVAEVRRPDGDLLALDASGGISCVDLQSMTVRLLGTVTLPEPGAEDSSAFWMASRWRLHASADGAFAAVVFDGGRHGLVIDLGRFETTMQLDGGDYYEKTVPFSACFASVNGKTALIHRTSWNRLDASDPGTGSLLTERGPTRYENEQRPPHYLDYFHGQIIASPSGSRLFDAGWVWQPVGVPRVFDIGSWLTFNVWESEDGPSAKWLGLRDIWNFPACWIDDDHVAMGGMGDWDDEEFETVAAPPGVRIVDVRQESDAPARKLRMDAEPHELFTDGSLLFASDGTDTSAWSLESDQRVTVIEGFAATHHHQRRKLLLEVKPRQLRAITAST